MTRTIQLPATTGPCLWVHLSAGDSDPAELDRLTTDWQLPPDCLAAVLDPDAVARHTAVDGGPHVISLLHPVALAPDGLSWATRLLVIAWWPGRDRILTAAAATPPFLEEIITAAEDLETPAIPALIMEIAEATARSFIRVTRAIDTERSLLVARLAHSTGIDNLIRLSQLQTSLVYFDTAVAENHPIYRRLETQPLSAAPEQRFNDRLTILLNTSYQAEKMVHQSATMLANLNATYSGIVSNRLNVTMKRLTALTIILTVPTIIGAFWGMNVALPFADHPLAFVALLVLSLLLCLLIVFLLQRRDLL
ncbi:MAG: magnesium transporter CorA family protein [Bacillota bacterium]|nr:magnesium transporter CorA family protein [Bacillota bacterium]